MQSLSHQIYRHKKFDVGRDVEKVALLIKEELIARSHTPCGSSGSNEEELSFSLCSSDDQETEFLPLPKRRRLASSSASVSSGFSLASHSSPPSLISVDTIKDICKYHVNMVRKFPKKERSPKDQERRNKNTIACRMSRRKKKFDDLQIEQQYKEYVSDHLRITEQSLRAKVYLNHLKLLVKREDHVQPAPRSNFSIDYLIGAIKREQVQAPGL